MAVNKTSNVNNSALENEILVPNPQAQLEHTTSAPALFNNSDNKRKRSDTASSSSSEKNPCKHKPSCTTSKQHVSFAHQESRHTDDALTIATSTTNADTRRGSLHDMGSGPQDKPQRTTINPMAEPMWAATRKHLIAKLKASLRADHLEELLNENSMPIEFFGAELLHRYYASNQGILSLPMQKLIGRQAREKADLVLLELQSTALSEGKKVDYYSPLTEQIYAHEEDPTFHEAESALKRVTTFYEKSERERLSALAAKERNRQPTTELEWTNLVCQPEVRPPTPGSSRSTSRGRKRARSRSKENKKNGAQVPQPTVEPSRSNTHVPATKTQSAQNLQQQANNRSVTLNIRQPQAPQIYQREQQEANDRRNQPRSETPRNANGNSYQGRGRGRGNNQRGQSQHRGNNRNSNYYQPQRQDLQEASSSRPREQSDSSDNLLAALTALTRKFNK